MSESDYKYSYKFPRRSLASLAVYNTGVQKCGPGYSWGPGVRDHYLFHYVISGQGHYHALGKIFRLQAGDLFVAYPDVNIFYQSDESEPWEYCWVGFNGTEAPLLLEQTDLSREHPVAAFPGGELYKQMMQIFAAQGSLPYQAAYMTGGLYQLFSLMMRSSQPKPQGSISGRYVAAACEFIANHHHLPIHIQDVADHVGLSRSRLYRIFQQEMQLSPMDYLSRFRIRQACSLLERPELSIKEAALSVGYDNQLYFSRRFREIMGCTPSEYRQGLVSAKCPPYQGQA